MGRDIDFNLYNLLTKSNTPEDSTDNFFESLKYRENGYKIIEVLKVLEDYEIIKGFDCNGNPDEARKFCFCLLKLARPEEKDNYIEIINQFDFIRSVKGGTEDTIAFFIKSEEEG